MQCEKCASTGPEGQEHYHIIVTDGRVSAVWYISSSGYWDRELTPDEYFVAYTNEN